MLHGVPMRYKALLTLIVIVLLAGCVGGDDASTTTPSPTTTAAPTTQSPTTTSPPTTQAPTTTAAPVSPIEWQSYDDALRAAQENDTYVYIYLWRRNCPYCDLMESDTFMDEEVTTYLGEHFESVSVNIWSSDPISEENPEITGRYIESKYRVPGAPSSVFLSPDGSLIKVVPGYDVVPGYKPPYEFRLMLEYVSTGSYMEMTFEQYVNSQQ